MNDDGLLSIGSVMPYIALSCFGLFGSCILLFGLSDVQEKRAFIATAAPATGTVKLVGNRIVETGSGATRSRSSIDYAEVEYQHPRAGNTVFEQQFGLVEGCPEKGATVDVLYNKDDPTDARISSFASMWAGTCLVIVIGLINIGLGLISYKLLSS